MKKPSASAKTNNGKTVRRPAPHPPRKRKPKDNLGDVPAMFGAMGPGFRVPGRPVPRVRKRLPKDSLGGVVELFRALGPNFYVPGRPLPRPRRPDSTLPLPPPKYMLDTNICIYMMKDGWGQVVKRLSLCEEGEAVMSAVSLAELRQGVALAEEEKTRQERAKTLAGILEWIPVLPFDAAAANCCEQLGVHARARERENDKLIAAHAFQRKLTLVTNDLRHFNRYPGLRLENWT